MRATAGRWGQHATVALAAWLAAACSPPPPTARIGTPPSPTGAELQELFFSLKHSTFRDVPPETRLQFREMRVFGYAPPFSAKVVINVRKLRAHGWPPDAVLGLLAHEMSHVVSYQRRTWLARLGFVFGYPFAKRAKRRVEHEADRIAIRKGYRAPLIASRIWALRSYRGRRLRLLRQVYYSPAQLRRLEP